MFTMNTKPAQLDPFAIETPAPSVTVRVSSPQSETLSSIYETPEDLVRFALGFAVCLWIVLHLFTLPRTAEGYRTWVYLGLVVAPVACAAAILIWR
jgi:hypothetical protein